MTKYIVVDPKGNRNFTIIAPPRTAETTTSVATYPEDRVTPEGETRVTVSGDVRVVDIDHTIYAWVIEPQGNRTFTIIAPNKEVE